MKNKLIYLPAIILVLVAVYLIAMLIVNASKPEEETVKTPIKYCSEDGECFKTLESLEDYRDYLKEQGNY